MLNANLHRLCDMEVRLRIDATMIYDAQCQGQRRVRVRVRVRVRFAPWSAQVSAYPPLDVRVRFAHGQVRAQP